MIGRGKAVLVVDPDVTVRQMLVGALRLLKFERVLQAETVAEGRAALMAGTTVDLALIDWDGEPSGFDLAADLRTGRVSRQHDLPIIMLAWKAEPRRALAVQGLKLNGFLVKPVSADMLERKVASALASIAKPVALVKPVPKRLVGQAS
jgi:DNA-binding NarL/FixJ family response regulator